MSVLSRRLFLGSTGVIPFSVWLQHAEGAGTTYTRYEARGTQGQAMLGHYKTGVQNMLNTATTPDTSPSSWVFQWYTHFVKGDTTKAAEIARIYKTDPKYKSLANEMWNTCQAHSAGQVENFFLPWHRMFVYFFERIVRKACKDTAFSLPYWNYSVSGPTHGIIPPEFAQAGSSLFIGKRNSGVNSGQPIDKNSPGSLNLDALKQPTYGASGSQAGFNQTLDFGLHGNVHVEVGNQLNMGQVPWAGGDPIFWMHHCNIDRLWASWNANGGTNLSDSGFTSKQFIFADENDNRVSATVKDFLAIAPLGYQYDHLEPKPAGFNPALKLTNAQLSAALKPTHTAAQVSLGAKPISVTLDSAPGITAFAAHVKALDSRRMYLVLRQLQTNAQPGVIYDVYLNTQAAANRIGSINFFAAMEHVHDADRFISFDITDVARKVGGNGEKPIITFAPAGEPSSSAKPVIGQVTLTAS